jgi:hypothetical protein
MRGARGRILLLTAALAIGASMPLAASGQIASEVRCELPPPTVLRRVGDAVLQTWELSAAQVWFDDAVPDAPGYVAYRVAIRAAGSDQIRPVADPPKPKDDAEREMWRREELNAELMYTGSGQVRSVRCLEAALFALQDARLSQLTKPTEFIAHILRRGDRLKIYFGGSDQPVPPKSVYGTEEVAADVTAGWTYWAILHNHPLRMRDGRPALGVPAPSTNDVQFSVGLVMSLGLQEVWVTNGLYTGVVTSADLPKFSVRD